MNGVLEAINEKKNRLLALDKQDVLERLGCSDAELTVWILSGKLPYDGLLHDGEGGWKPETIEQAKTQIEKWR